MPRIRVTFENDAEKNGKTLSYPATVKQAVEDVNELLHVALGRAITNKSKTTITINVFPVEEE